MFPLYQTSLLLKLNYIKTDLKFLLFEKWSNFGLRMLIFLKLEYLYIGISPWDYLPNKLLVLLLQRCKLTY